MYSYEISQTTSSTEPLKRPGCELLSMRGSADGVFSVAVLRKIAWSPGRTKRRIGRRTMRAIGLVLLSIAIMALLLTDANAKRRSSAQGSQAAGEKAGARPIPVRASTTTAAIPRSTSAIKRRSWAAVAFADPIRFRARLTGPATPDQVRCASAAAGLTDRRARAQQEGVVMKTLVAVAILAMVIVPPLWRRRSGRNRRAPSKAISRRSGPAITTATL